MVRKIFQEWWDKHVAAGDHSRGQTKEEVLLDFIGTLVDDGVIKSHEFAGFLADLYHD